MGPIEARSDGRLKLAAVYVRVSSDRQTENQSIDVQLTECRKLADGNDFAVYREYADGGFSGMSNNRPGLQELLADAEARAFDAIIVWDQSRFGRDSVDVELNLKRLEELGIAENTFVIFSICRVSVTSPEALIPPPRPRTAVLPTSSSARVAA